MKIGIIGAGMIGGTLARRLARLGHDVVISNSRGPETILERAADVGATAVTVKEAARGKEIVIVTIPQRAVADLPKSLFAGVPADVVVIDTGNYYPSRGGSNRGAPCYTKDLEAPRLKEALAGADRGAIAECRRAADDAARAYFKSEKRGGPWLE